MIHDEGGVAVVPHPMSWLTRSLSERTLERLAQRTEAGITFDAIELGNPSPAGRVTRDRALRLNQRWGLPAVGGSDAHHLAHVGSGWTEFSGRTAEELKSAILAGEVVAGLRPYASMREVGFGRVALGLAWGYAATPRKMLRAAVPRRERP